MRLIDADEIRIKPEYMHDICGVVMIRVEDVGRIINNMPTINPEPERKKGKWIDIGSGQECSVCHEIQYGYDNFRYFCAFCGADMEEGGLNGKI